MASANDYANWIVANETKKGTPEFDTVAKAYQEAKAEEAVKQEPTTTQLPNVKPQSSLAEKILPSTSPIAQKYAEAYKQMPQMLQDPYLGLSTSNIGKVGNAMFGVAEQAPGVLSKYASIITHPIENAGEALKGKAQTFMQSALKPTLKQSQTGRAQTAINTLLEQELPITKETVDTLKSNISNLNQDISSKIAGSTATVKKSDVLKPLNALYEERMVQTNPEKDLNAIESARQEFLKYNKGEYNPNVIPVQLAQDLKQGTYRALSDKYGGIPNPAEAASIKAQKTLARGLREQIASEVPAVKDLNAQESKLLDTLGVTERRMFMTLNKDPFGLSMLATNPLKTAAMLMDRSPAFKSILAIQMNKLGNALKSPELTTSSPKLPLYTGRLVNEETQSQ